MPTVQIPKDSVEELRSVLNGPLVGPGDVVYEDARQVHNGLIDRRPAFIARCRGTADVVDALAFAREHGLEVAVRGGGHNVAGRSAVDDGLMVDLSPMRGIHVDPKHRTATAQGGVTWGDLNKEAHLHKLATTGGLISTTGIGGLTLGGGIGYLMGKYGLAVDNLISAEVVLADGRVVVADEDNEPDLFWAIRGGGGNFGIVTSFEYRLHPMDMVTAGLVAHPFERAREVLSFYRDLTADLPDEVVAFGGMVHAPDGSGSKLAAIVLMDCRPPGTDDAVVTAVKEFGTPIIDAVEPMPYPAANQMMDGGYPKGALNYWKSNFLRAVTDDVLDLMVDRFAEAQSPMDALLLEHFHGALTRVPTTATAYPHRGTAYNLAITSQWMDPALTDACIAWARETFDAMRPHFAEARYSNYLGDDEGGDPAAAAYGPNLSRLRELKKRYDPENVFHLNQNIRPAD
jgi:FAD/FMN-containing dehydrogenase